MDLNGGAVIDSAVVDVRAVLVQEWVKKQLQGPMGAKRTASHEQKCLVRSSRTQRMG